MQNARFLQDGELLSLCRVREDFRIESSVQICRFVSQMADSMVIRDAADFARMGRIWAGLVSYFHEFLALRALSGEIKVIAYDS